MEHESVCSLHGEQVDTLLVPEEDKLLCTETVEMYVEGTPGARSPSYISSQCSNVHTFLEYLFFT